MEGAAEDAKTNRLAVPDPDALAALVLPGETGGGDVYFAFEVQELALPDIYSDACVERDAQPPKTLPVLPQRHGGRRRGRGADARPAARGAGGAGSGRKPGRTRPNCPMAASWNAGSTPNSPIGWAMAATLTLAVEAV